MAFSKDTNNRVKWTLASRLDKQYENPIKYGGHLVMNFQLPLARPLVVGKLPL